MHYAIIYLDNYAGKEKNNSKEVMEQENLKFSESFIDDDLKKMVLKVMECDYRSLIDWIVDYRYRSYDKKTFLELEKDFITFRQNVSGLVKEYKKFLRWSRLEQAECLYNTTIVLMVVGFRDKYRYILKHYPDMYEKLNDIRAREFRNEKELTSVRDLLVSIADNIELPDSGEYIKEQDTYRQKLSDHMFLLDELIDILTSEHNRRIIAVKDIFKHSISAHENQIANIRNALTKTTEQIEKLAGDTLVAPGDKEQLLTGFRAKESELSVLLASEKQIMRKLKDISTEYSAGFKEFRSVIESFVQQREGFRARSGYMESLVQIGKDIPDLKKNQEQILSIFEQNLSGLKKSFILCSGGLQKKMIEAIEKQENVNRIVYSDADHIEEEYVISLKNGMDTPVETGIGEDIVIDLKGLAPMGEKSGRT